jgi:hypothetical protein
MVRPRISRADEGSGPLSLPLPPGSGSDAGRTQPLDSKPTRKHPTGFEEHETNKRRLIDRVGVCPLA